jgi:Tol biopolymer transport system component
MFGNGNCRRAANPRLRASKNLRAIVLLALAVRGVATSVSFASDIQSTHLVAANDVLARQRSFPAMGHAGALSPGGVLLAYTIRSGVFAAENNTARHYTASGMLPEYGTGTELRVSNTRTGAVVQVSEGQGAVSDPVWSPDGSQLAFVADRGGAAHVWLWSKETMQLRRLADAIVRPSFFDGANLKWTLDGKYIVALALPKDMTVAQADARGQGSSRDATAQMLAVMSADVALFDAVTGDVRRLARDKSVFWCAPSPDGRSVAYAYPSARAPGNGQWLYTMEVTGIEVGTARVVAESTYANDGAFAWSPDSTRIAYFASGTRGKDGAHVIDIAAKTDREATSITFSTLEANDIHRRVYWTPDGVSLLFILNGRLWRVTPQTGEATMVTPAEWNREIVQIVARGRSGVVWTRDGGRSITVTTRDLTGEIMGFYRIEVATGKVTKLREDGKRYGDYVKPALASDDGTFVFWAAEDAKTPMDLWGAGPNLKDALRLTQLNP